MARQMKDSGIEWIGEIPETWETSRVGLHYSIILGKMLCPNQVSENYTLEPYFCAADVHFDGVSTEGLKQMWFSADEKEAYIVHNGDLLVVEGGAGAGGCAIARNMPRATYIQNSIMIVRKKNGDNRFLRYWIEMLVKRGYIDIVCNKATIPHFTKDKLANVPLPILSDNEMSSIADFLDRKCAEIDAVLERTKTTIEEYKKLKQAVITEAVTKGVRGPRPMKDSGIEWIGEIPEGWRTVPLKAFVDILPGYAFSSDDFCTEKGIPLLRGINVAPNSIRWDETVRYDLPITDQLAPFQLQEGDIVVGLDRPWISDGTRIAWVTAADVPSLLLQRVCRIRAKAEIDLRWVFHWIASNAFQESLSTETTGVSVPHISTKQIGNFVIAFPGYDEQRETCDYLDEKCSALDTLIAKKTTLLTELETYKKSLIYEYVTGKKEVTA